MSYSKGNYSEESIPCILGVCVYPQEYILRKYQTVRANIFIPPIIGALQYELSSLQYVYLCIFLCLVVIGLINNIFSLMTCLRDRIRYTICGVYVIMYSTCGLVLMVLLLTNITTVTYYDEQVAQLWACHGYPYLTLTMVDTGILISVAFAIEGVLTKRFKYDKFRHRTVAILNCISFLFIASISNLDKVLTRYLIVDRFGHFYCLHESDSYKSWSTILLFIYVLLPCIIHFICMTCILCIQSKDNCIRRIFRYQHYVIPSLFILLCLFINGSYRYFHLYVTASSKHTILVHSVFVLLLYAPQVMTYMLYVATDEFYVKEFYQIWFYRKLCCCFYNRRRHVQEFEVIHRLWQRRTSLETVKTISSLDDTYMDSEFYKK